MRRRSLLILGGVVGGFGIILALVLNTLLHPLVISHLLLSLVVIVSAAMVQESQERLRPAIAPPIRIPYNLILRWSVVLAIVALAGWRITINDQRWDLTASQRFSLDTRTIEVLAGLKEKLNLVAVKGDDLGEGSFSGREMLELIAAVNPQQITLEFIDPRRAPQRVTELELKPNQQLYINLGGRVGRLNAFSEREFLTVLQKLAGVKNEKVYYVVGYGEPALADPKEGGLREFAALLADAAIAVEELPLRSAHKIPDDASALMIIAPRKEIEGPGQELIKNYAASGGSLLLMIDPDSGYANRSLAEAFGIVVREDLILDPSQRAVGAPNWEIIARHFVKHPVNDGVANRQITLFAGAASLARSKEVEVIGDYTELAFSSESSWAESDLKMAREGSGWGARINEEDRPGPATLAIAFEGKQGRVLVFGDASWIENQYLDLYGNRDLALNMVAWTGSGGGARALPARVATVSLAPITKGAFQIILAVTFLIPELILLSGLLICASRKYAQ